MAASNEDCNTYRVFANSVVPVAKLSKDLNLARLKVDMGDVPRMRNNGLILLPAIIYNINCYGVGRVGGWW